MGHYRKSIWENTFLSFGIPIFFGILCGLAGCVLFSAVSFLVFKGMMFGKLFNLLTLFISGYFSGHLCGRYRRRRGMIDGAICGAVIYAVLLSASVAFGEFTDLRKLMLLAAAGAIGGIAGVNSSRPKNLM